MKHKIYTGIVIALFVILAIILSLIVVFTVRELTGAESQSDISVNEVSINDVSVNDVSEVSKDESTPEVSVEPEKSVWFNSFQLNLWYDEYKVNQDMVYEKWEATNDSDIYKSITDDGRHVSLYLEIDGTFMNFIGSDIYRYIELFGATDDCNFGAICEYFGVSKEEYIEFCEGYLERFCKVPYGEKPFMYAPVMLNWDAWFTEEYWEHPDFLFRSRDFSVYDCYYTSVPDRGNYTRRYYRIDYDLIQYVTEEEFYKWIDAVEDKEQNILAFIEYFDIDEEEYRAIYEYKGGKIGNPTPYNPDYLFGTAEMQEEYFTVHPLN